jgi:hypothetical protein
MRAVDAYFPKKTQDNPMEKFLVPAPIEVPARQRLGSREVGLSENPN